MQTVSPACTHTTHNCIETTLFLLNLQNMTIKHPLDLSPLINICILPRAPVIQTFLVINQTRAALDYLSRPDKSVPRLEERGGRKCNFKDTALCMAGQHFSLFYCLWDHLTTFSVQRLQSTSQILPDYNLQRYEVLSQGQSGTQGRVCAIAVISRLRSRSPCRRRVSFCWGSRARLCPWLPGLGVLSRVSRARFVRLSSPAPVHTFCCSAQFHFLPPSGELENSTVLTAIMKPD